MGNSGVEVYARLHGSSWFTSDGLCADGARSDWVTVCPGCYARADGEWSRCCSTGALARARLLLKLVDEVARGLFRDLRGPGQRRQTRASGVDAREDAGLSQRDRMSGVLDSGQHPGLQVPVGQEEQHPK